MHLPPHTEDKGHDGSRRVIVRMAAQAWIAPLTVLAGFSSTDGVCALLSGDDTPQPSFIFAEPDAVQVSQRRQPESLFDDLAQPEWQAGVIGLASYDAGARQATGERGPAEPLAGEPGEGWPDLMLIRYSAWLVFDPHSQTITAVGLGADETEARTRTQRALHWLEQAGVARRQAPAASLDPETPDADYEAGVATIVGMIGRGDLFQANLARAWSGVLDRDAHPFDTLFRLGERSAAFGAALQIGDRAVVSNSPELFVSFDAEMGRIETRPIKGTRARGLDAVTDDAALEELTASAKDRAENLMIVDLMRNDLSRVARPGSVQVERLFGVESLPTVHHLVSTVTAQAGPGIGNADLLKATFPPGSITGAPKHQAMKVIAELEPPRGPWCGSLAFVDETQSLTASVLIRTVAFGRQKGVWYFRTLAGAGIVADSDPQAEARECDAKIRAVAEALTGRTFG